MANLMQARVKAVLSGDTVVLSAMNNPKSERTLSLAFVSAPRLRREGDEPFAFASRDFLRRLLVGRVVQFRVLYTIPTSKRDYGIILMAAGGPMLPEAAAAEGWVRVRDDANKKDDKDESSLIVEKLQVAESHARIGSKGVWADDGGRVDCAYDLPDAKAFVEQNKGKQLEGVVEKVLSGDRMIARLIITSTSHVQTLVLIAGIRAPSTKRVNTSDGKEQPAEPFGDEAQQFIESRLLQRNVVIEVLGASPQGQVIATVKHPVQGTVAPHLLKAGLARCTDFHSTMLGAEMGALRQAEKEARDARRGLFQGLQAKAAAGGELEAVVSRIMSADTLFLRNKAGAEKRINLSSVRQPKPSDPKQAPWQAEAKEFLRKKLIGKHVKVHIDGKRAATEGYEEREMATVTFGGKNVGLMLVENGLASVIRHRADDADRSPIYDDLLLAEQQAQEQKKGLWADKPPQARSYVDYSENQEKAKRHLTMLSRQRRVPAVVDFVKSGSRFTILVPRENSKLTLVLGGIRAPRSARNPNEQSEPFGQEAHDFANRRCLQRDVEIDVDDVDKVGGFIGTLYVNRENFAKLLLEEGLASVHAYSAEKSGHSAELYAAEKKAKEQRKGMWHNWDPSQDEVAEEEPAANGNATAEPAAPREKDYRDVVITHVDESGHLKVQQVGQGTAALTELMTSFRNFHLNKANDKALPGAPKVGDFVSAKFSDGNWYRARVRRNDREAKKAEVLYVDYGNGETVPWSELRPLDGEKFGTAKLRPQAVDATLAFVQLPGAPNYLADAIGFVREVFCDRLLVASVDFVEKDGTLAVTLFDPDKSQKVEDSLNGELVAEGLAMVPRKLKTWERGAEILGALKKREEEAKEERRGMWEYGDLTADD
ncbi:hypothetical protein EJ06DRAFT_583878 [Trichodelitschia bisporula]|uniref:Probable endonuclease LCL3 n=1 Tax=Trichodelitschia bisporula TaxID=703511 RepID=A0A6G1HQC8_9PEZI|nr:hypothetical protein EJ06DRAFT_583878 [Trichodelitschia bisporula]